jgi:xylose isomerase|tara:strand:+ start:18139 stop:19479 length:1341 start_codon:yes stop_codon:yes gene_type:complete
MSKVFIGNREYFPGISQIKFEGNSSDNPLAFKCYDAKRMVGTKSMRDHLRFAICYWHNFCNDGSDIFGPGTQIHPWNEKSDPLAAAEDKLDAAFEFFTKLDVPFYCFHDVDLAPDGTTVAQGESYLRHMVDLAKVRQQATGVQLLWGTANVFSNPRYMNGASTNPNFDVVAHAGAQVKRSLDATVALGGENYVFWGGREGYACLFNTDTRRELEHMGQFLTMARDYGRSIGFRGTFLIEPKPMEPMYHQYDVDAQTVIGFLRQYGLDNDFKLNIEANHATLSGHSFAHELQMSADAGLLGSIDANRGNAQNGWDTDQFPTDLHDTVQAMLVVLASGGLKSGGLNFDAKLRRESTSLEDMFLAHIGGMDCFARGLLAAHSILEKSSLAQNKKDRYSSFDEGPGAIFEAGGLTLTELRDHAEVIGEPELVSGRQESIENMINDHLFRA